MAALPFGYALACFGGMAGLAAGALFVTALGGFAAQRYAQKSGIKDDPSIVIDEAAGLWIAALPAGDSWVLWAAAFLLFRLFDIWKPWPVSFFDLRGRGALDVMMDDIAAGLYALCGVSILAVVMLV